MPAKCNQWVINVCPLHYKKQWQRWISAQLRAADHSVVVAVIKMISQQQKPLLSSPMLLELFPTSDINFFYPDSLCDDMNKLL